MKFIKNNLLLFLMVLSFTFSFAQSDEIVETETNIETSIEVSDSGSIVIKTDYDKEQTKELGELLEEIFNEVSGEDKPTDTKGWVFLILGLLVRFSTSGVKTLRGVFSSLKNLGSMGVAMGISFIVSAIYIIFESGFDGFEKETFATYSFLLFGISMLIFEGYNLVRGLRKTEVEEKEQTA